MKKYLAIFILIATSSFALTPTEEYQFTQEEYEIISSYEQNKTHYVNEEQQLLANHDELSLRKLQLEQKKNLFTRNAKLLNLRKRALLADHLDPELQPAYLTAKDNYERSLRLLNFSQFKLNFFVMNDTEKHPELSKAPEKISPPSYIKVGYRGGRGVGYHHSYSSAFLFLTPNWDRQFQPFFDLRTHILTDGRFASNFGGGLRFISDNEDCVLGVNAYHDFRSSHDLHTHQMGLGLEGLFPYFDVRINGYLPVAKYTKIEPIVFHRFTGNIIEVTRLVRRAYPTVNAEFGVPIPGNFCRKASLYLGVGPYYLFGDKIQEANFKHSYGVKGRVTAKFFDMLGLEFVISHDHVYHLRVQGAVSFQIPLGRKKPGQRSCSAKEAMLARAKAPPERNEIIPIKKKQEFFPHTDANGRVLSFIYVNNTAGCPGTGTFESPFCSLAFTQAGTSSANDLIYVFKGDGTTNLYNTGYNIQPGQRFQGSGESFLFHGVNIPAMTSGNPTVINPGSDVLTMSSNSIIDGFNIQYNTLVSGINATNISNILIQNNTLNATGISGNGILLQNLQGASTIQNNTFSGPFANGDAIFATSTAGIPPGNKLTVESNIFQNYGFSRAALFFDDVNIEFITINRNTFVSTTGTGPDTDLSLDNFTFPTSYVITSNNFTTNSAVNILIVDVAGGSFTIDNNIIVRFGTPPGLTEASISYEGRAVSSIIFTNNLMNSFPPSTDVEGIEIFPVAAATVMKARISNNTISGGPTARGISMISGAAATVCMDMQSNSAMRYNFNIFGATLNITETKSVFESSNVVGSGGSGFVYNPPSPPNANIIFNSSCTPP